MKRRDLLKCAAAAPILTLPVIHLPDPILNTNEELVEFVNDVLKQHWGDQDGRFYACSYSLVDQRVVAVAGVAKGDVGWCGSWIAKRGPSRSSEVEELVKIFCSRMGRVEKGDVTAGATPTGLAIWRRPKFTFPEEHQA